MSAVAAHELPQESDTGLSEQRQQKVMDATSQTGWRSMAKRLKIA
jgi:hypothetical protein